LPVCLVINHASRYICSATFFADALLMDRYPQA
jgi:hypothetical protein